MQNNPNSFKKFKKIPIILSVLFLIVSYVVFNFLYKKINNNKTISENAQIEWQNESSRRSEIKSLERSVKNIEGEKTLLESHFVQSSDIVPFLNSIERLALEVKAKSEVVSVDILKDIPALSVTLKASGSFESIYKFLKLLENSSYELEFVSVDIKSGAINTIPNVKTTTSSWEAVFKIKLLSFILVAN